MFYELFWPAKGGVETWIASVSKELVKKGHQVDVITGSIPETPKLEIMDGFTIRRIGGKILQKNLFYTPGYGNLKRQILWMLFIAIPFWRHHKDEYDIIHAHIHPSFLGALFGAGPKKLIWTWHGTYHNLYFKMFPLFQAFFYELADHLIVKFPFSACITVDRHTMKIAIEHLKAPHNKRIYVIDNGVDIERFRPLKVEKPKDWPNGFHIVSARRLVPKSGIQYLIPSLKSIVRERPDVHTMIYGSGPMEKNLLQITRKSGLERNVHFMGEVSYDEIPYIYNASDLIVVPSLIEGSPLSCFEAMACGKLLITCPVGGIIDIAPQELVLYAEPANYESLERTLRKAIFEMCQEDRQRIGEMAMEHVKKYFTLEKTTEQILKVYEIVLQCSK